jgi:hypothetical protein
MKRQSKAVNLEYTCQCKRTLLGTTVTAHLLLSDIVSPLRGITTKHPTFSHLTTYLATNLLTRQAD